MPSILIATEDAALYEVFAAECMGEGHSVAWAVDGYEAQHSALTSGPDLVLLDPQLRIFNGFEACEALRADPQVPSRLPIFLLSDDEVNPHLLLRIRATGVFPKTHAAHELRELLSAQLMHHDRLEREREALQQRPSTP